MAVENGMRTIGEDGLQKALEGKTTIDEVARVVYLAEQGVKLCPGCKDVVMKEYEYCPNCGDFVGEHCEHCRHRLNPDWTFCPHCGNDSRENGTAKRGRTRQVIDKMPDTRLRKAS